MSHIPTDGPDIVLAQYEHSGPLPDQRWFESVEKLHPGTTRMLLEDYREQREHAREMEKASLALDEKNLNGFVRYQLVRLWLAGAVAILLVVAGIVLVAVGRPVVGLAILVAEIAGLAAVFLTGRLLDRSEAPADTGEAT